MICTWLSPVFSVSQSISRLFVCDPSSQQKPHGWMEDNRGHLLSVWTCWCSATETVLPGVLEGLHAARCTACTRGHRLTESPLWAPGSTGACLHCTRAQTQELQRSVCVCLKWALLKHDRYITVPLTLIGAAWWNTEKLSVLWDVAAFPLSYIKSKLISGWVNWIAEYLSSHWGGVNAVQLKNEKKKKTLSGSMLCQNTKSITDIKTWPAPCFLGIRIKFLWLQLRKPETEELLVVEG